MYIKHIMKLLINAYKVKINKKIKKKQFYLKHIPICLTIVIIFPFFLLIKIIFINLFIYNKYIDKEDD